MKKLSMWTCVVAVGILVVPACKKNEEAKEEPGKKEPAKAASAKKDPKAGKKAKPDQPDAPDMSAMMPKASFYVRHKVKDFDKWKAAFDAHTMQRAAAGIMWHVVARDVKDPNTVVYRGAGMDLDKMKAFAASEDLQKTMMKSGVEGKPEIWYANNTDMMPPMEDARKEQYTIIVKHDVEDYDKWKKGFDAHADGRKQATVFSHIVSRHADNPNTVVVTLFAGDMNKVMGMFGAEDTKKKMQEAGVKGEPTIWASKTTEWWWTGPGMKTVVFAHEVEDYDKWKQVFDKHADKRKGAGAMGHWLGRADGNDKMVIAAIWGAESIVEFAKSPELEKAMAEAGVKGEPTVWTLNQVDGLLWPSAGESEAGMFVKHEVADFDKWKTTYDGHASARAAAGFTRLDVNRVADNDKTVVVWGTGHALGALKKFGDSPDLKKAMKESGVSGKPEVWFATAVELVKYM